MKRYVITLIVWLAFVLCALPAAAVERILSFQTPGPETIEPGEAIRLTWTYDDAAFQIRPAKFRLYLGTSIVRNFIGSDLDVVTVAGVQTYTTKAGVVAPFTAAQIGSQVYSLTAYDSTGETPPSANTLTVTVKFISTAPALPTGFKRYRPPVGGLVLDFNSKTGELRTYLQPELPEAITNAIGGTVKK